MTTAHFDGKKTKDYLDLMDDIADRIDDLRLALLKERNPTKKRLISNEMAHEIEHLYGIVNQLKRKRELSQKRRLRADKAHA